MPAQGVTRDRCRIGERRFADDGAVVRWCLSHDAPAAHAREAGEVGADPADVPRLSDLTVTDAEEQYAGRLPTAPDGDRHNAVADAAYRLLRDPEQEENWPVARGALATLRAESTAAAAGYDPRPQLFPVRAVCGRCAGQLRRSWSADDRWVRVEPWRHVLDPAGADHDPAPAFA